MIERIELDPRIKIRSAADLVHSPRIVRVHGFDEDSSKQFMKDVSAASSSGQPLVPVLIDSYGGDVYSLLSMVDVLKSLKVPVATVVTGKAMSSAAILFTCGTQGYRFMGPNATLMLHDVGSDPGPEKAEEVKASARETGRLNRKTWQMMEKNIGQPPGFLWKLAQKRGRADWYMTPREAVRLGIANHVRVPVLRTRIRVDMALV